MKNTKTLTILLLILIPVVMILLGRLFLYVGWIMVGTVLLRILQILVAIAAVVIIGFLIIFLAHGDGSGWWLWLLGIVAAFGISAGMIWICDRIFQAYGITSTFFSGFLKAIGAVFEIFGG